MSNARFLPAALLFLGVAGSAVAAAQKADSNPSPFFKPEIAEKSQQDLDRTMAMLGIKSLRPAPGPNPELANSTNFDESKAGPISKLPDPLVLNDGTMVTSADAWWKVRRPQIVEAFDREVVGRMPRQTPAVRWEVKSTTHGTNGGISFLQKQLVGHVDNSNYPSVAVEIELTLTVPEKIKRPAPVIMQFTMGDKEWAVVADFLKDVNMADMLAEPIGGKEPSGYNWQREALRRGWAYASYIPASVQLDNGPGLTQGIIGLLNKGKPRSKPDDPGVLRAWAWGASRAQDYLEQDHSVDAKHVAIAGASRYGKAALVAMAYDTRFATANISSSGEAGAKLYRRNFGEQIENIAAMNEYHWMAPNFLKYAGPLNVSDLPVDANELIALCAPRPIFIGAGRTRNEGKWSPIGSDGWADAKGQFLAAVDAGRVYALLGKKPLPTNVFPPIGTALINTDVAFRQHPEGHVTAPNWPTFIKFAERYFPVEAQ